MKNQILLVDESLPLDNINFKYQKIISLDFISHERLNSKKIEHIVSDSFISENEIHDLQKQCFDFAHWFENFDIKNCILYKNINLGELFYVDFYTYLLPVLKTFFELSKIVSKYSDSFFLSSSKISNFLKNFPISFEEISKKNDDTEFYLDTINHEIKFNKLTLPISLSSSNFKFLKRVSENIFKYFFRHDFISSKKTHILIEFDLLRYKKLFLTLPGTSNFVIYNRRRPYFWNLDSFSIMKKSSAYFFREKDLSNYDLKNNLINSFVWNSNTISNLKKFDSFFKNFFKINENSFWPIIKHHFFSLCQNRFQELIHEIEYAYQLFEKTNPSSITIWSELGSTEQILLNVAKNQNVPIILLQHGYYHDDIRATNFNYFSGVLPKKSDYFLIWGNKMNDYCKKIDLMSKKIKIIGSLLFDTYKNFKSTENDYVLLATQGPTDFFISDLMNSTYENYINTIIEICEITKKLEKKLIIKLHPDPHELDITKYIVSLYPDVRVEKFGDIKNLIKDCELFISIDISTTILEAQLLKKPVISVSVKDYNLGDSNSQIFQSCVYTNISNLESNMIKIFDDLKFKNKIISSGSKFTNDYLSNQNYASNTFIHFLNNI